MKRRFFLFLEFLGFNHVVASINLKGLNFFYKDLRKIKKQLAGDPEFPITRLYPILGERFTEGGTLQGAYFHQDLLIARRIFQNNPVKHMDIGSRTDGFVAHVASFREIEVFDIRNITSNVKNIKFVQADFMSLHPELYGYTDSLSCLHAIEHFGLGRYNDPIDAYGHLKGLDAFYQVLKRGGKFYISFPIGNQRIEFNAHRVFDLNYSLKLFKDKYHIDNFSYVDDKGDLFENYGLNDEQGVKNNFGCSYGCGIFEMTKI